MKFVFNLAVTSKKEIEMALKIKAEYENEK